MEIHLAKALHENPHALEAARLVRQCVHCGFCNATCPTYQLLGDEADGPRGRIYLLKKMLESGLSDQRTRVHLDRCLLCRNCETTCPSGVQYGALLESGRQVQQALSARSKAEQLGRKALTTALLAPQPLRGLIALAQQAFALLPAGIKVQIPDPKLSLLRPSTDHPRKVLLLNGCVQSSLAPHTNAATARVLDKFGITVLEPKARCCGAMRLHTTTHEEGLTDIRALIDSWWPTIESGVEAIIFTASGCGLTIKDYGALLKDDDEYAQKAQQISALARDISQVVAAEMKQSPLLLSPKKKQRVAFHPPCTLQHGLKLDGVVEKILDAVGHSVLPVKDKHLCCGSAGTYSIFQKKISQQLKANKLKHLQADGPDIIASANIGCQQQLRAAGQTKVVHWIELLE